MPQRIPSPRELQYHTQSIMQNALIRKKLEEQRENYRKRQEQEKQENAKKNQQEVTCTGEMTSTADHVITTSTPTSVITTSSHDEKAQQLQESPGKKTAPIIQIQQRHHAPSPSIFTLTPTSVLRKMTAEKDYDSKGEKKKSLLAGLPQSQQQQQQQPIRNQQPPFGGSLSQMERLKMAQSDAGMFGGNNMNPWESQSMQGMKPSGKN